jgi:hypothetical protein
MVESILGTVVAILGFFGISFVVEKTPIKINPLSIIKKFLVGDLSEKIDTIGKRVDENEADRIRETILSYKKSMDNGIPLSEHEYEYILKIYDKYKNVLKQNSFVEYVVEEIKILYKKQLENQKKLLK